MPKFAIPTDADCESSLSQKFIDDTIKNSPSLAAFNAETERLRRLPIEELIGLRHPKTIRGQFNRLLGRKPKLQDYGLEP